MAGLYFVTILIQPIGCLSLLKINKNINLIMIVNDCADITFFELLLTNEIITQISFGDHLALSHHSLFFCIARI